VGVCCLSEMKMFVTHLVLYVLDIFRTDNCFFFLFLFFGSLSFCVCELHESMKALSSETRYF